MSNFRGHRPSGKSSWPLVLVAGAEKTGKSYLAAEFSSSDLIGQMFWIEFGENTAEHYGAVPGANYVLADHDGTFNDVCRRAREAIAEPMLDGKPNVIVIDSVSMIWETLSAEAQELANRRRKVNDPDAESKITSDIWNLVTDRWKKLLRILRSHNGPVILIARLDVVAVMDAAGQPTKEKTQKVKAQKNLPYDVDVIVQIPEYRKFQLTGVRSLVLQVAAGEKFDVPSDFTLDGLMRKMGLPADGFTEPRAFVEPVPSADDAVAERNGGAPPDRPMQRQQPRTDDDWTRPVPELATAIQVEWIVRGLRSVRGLTEQPAMQAAVEAMVGHAVPDLHGLAVGEAVRIIAVLVAENEAKQGPPAVGTPDNPGITDAQKKMIQAHFSSWSRENRLAEIARILDAGPVESVNDLSKAEASRVIDAIGTPAPQPVGAAS